VKLIHHHPGFERVVVSNLPSLLTFTVPKRTARTLSTGFKLSLLCGTTSSEEDDDAAIG
jgi:hypothetical protein